MSAPVKFGCEPHVQLMVPSAPACPRGLVCQGGFRARRGLPPLGPVDTCALGGAEASL